MKRPYYDYRWVVTCEGMKYLYKSQQEAISAAQKIRAVKPYKPTIRIGHILVKCWS